MEIKDKLLSNMIKRGEFIVKGAESDLYLVEYLGLKAILKYRTPKEYRIKELDEKIRRRRTAREATILYEAYKLGVNVPRIFHLDLKNNYIVLEYIQGDNLRDALLKGAYSKRDKMKIFYLLGKMIGVLHNKNIVHGDLTTANVIVKQTKKEPYLIDFGLSEKNADIEGKAVDIEMFYRVLESTHTKFKQLTFESFIKGYKDNVLSSNEIISRFMEIRKMGRYVERKIRQKS
jgi:TP53 regulating kinase-like protein